MSMRCTVCTHPDRSEIDKALVAGATVRDIARQHGLGHDSVHRHSSAHVRTALRKNFATRRILHETDLAKRIEMLLTETVDILEDAREGEQSCTCPSCEARFTVKTNGVRDRVAAASVVGKTLELVGRLTGQLSSNTTNNLFLTLGANEAEIRRALELTRREMTPEEAEQEALACLRFVLIEKPERRAQILAAIGGRAIEANGNENRTNGGSNGAIT